MPFARAIKEKYITMMPVQISYKIQAALVRINELEMHKRLACVFQSTLLNALSFEALLAKYFAVSLT